MSPRTKKAASKPPCEPSAEPEHIEFAIPEHQAWFERLSKLKLGQLRFPDLNALKEVQRGDEIADEIEELLAIGSWQRLLFIHEYTIHLLAL